MDEKELQKIAVPVAIGILAIISFFIVKPILSPIILGLLFSYIFYPVFTRLNRKIKSKYICSGIILLIILLAVITPMLLLLPTFIKESFNLYLSIKDFDVYSLAGNLAPSLLESKDIGTEIIAASNNFKSSISTVLFNLFKNTLMNFGGIIFGILIFLFTLFFALIEGDKFKDYFSVLFPFSKENREKFYDKFDKVTNAVVYGQIVIGIAQGIIAGIGYYLLGVPNAFLFTVVTAAVGIIPVIGPWLVWMPLDAMLFINGQTGIALGLLIYGLFVINLVDTLLRPQIVSSQAEMNSAIALIGVIGGIYAFGPLIGFFIGPLVLAYLILLIEIYSKKEESIVLKKETSEINK